MRIFNQDKTIELYNVDLEKGYLVNDTLFVKHYNAVEAVSEQGHYETIKEYPNGGKDVQWIIDIPEVKAKDAYDEYEDIQVYVPYTEEELKDILRKKRRNLLDAFDKWEKAVLRGREQDEYLIMSWYEDLKDLKETAFKNIPERINYYLRNV